MEKLFKSKQNIFHWVIFSVLLKIWFWGMWQRNFQWLYLHLEAKIPNNTASTLQHRYLFASPPMYYILGHSHRVWKVEFLQQQLVLFLRKKRITASPDAYSRCWEGITPRITQSICRTFLQDLHTSGCREAWTAATPLRDLWHMAVATKLQRLYLLKPYSHRTTHSTGSLRLEGTSGDGWV